MKGRIYILLILSAINWYVVNAQPTNLSFTHFGTENGITDNNITCIIEDNLGFMWFGTTNGLFRYDGHEFKRYAHNPEIASSLSGNEIKCLLVDAKKRLWVGTTEGLNLYHSEYENFTVYTANSNVSNNLSNSWIGALYEDNNHNLWVGCWDGLNKFDTKTNTFSYYPFPLTKEKTQWCSSSINCIKQTNEQLIIGTFCQGLWFFNTKELTFKPVTLSLPDEPGKPANGINDIYVAPDGRIWLSNWGQGLFLLDKTGKQIKTFSYNHNPCYSSYNQLYKINSNSNGTLWIGSEEGLYWFNTQNGKFALNRPNSQNVKTLGDKTVFIPYTDSKGGLWVGTPSGLNYYHPLEKKFTSYNLQPTNLSNLENNYITGFAQDSKGMVYISWYYGIDKFDPATQTISRLNIPKTENLQVNGIFLDSQGWLWCLSQKLGAYNTNTHQYLSFNQYNIFTSITEDWNKNIWIGSNDGLIFYNRKLNYFINIKGIYKSITGSNYELYDHPIIANKRIFVCAGSKLFEIKLNDTTLFHNKKYQGAFSYDGKKIHATIINTSNSLSRLTYLYSSAQKGTITFINADSYQKIYSYNINTNRFKYLFSTHLVQKETPVIEDKTGNLWIGNKGLWMLNKDRKTNLLFSKEDGLPAIAFNYAFNSFFQHTNGTLFFATKNGFATINPCSIKTNPVKPAVYLTKLWLYNTAVEVQPVPNKKTTKVPFYLPISITKLTKLDLKYNQNFIGFEFSALNYINSDKNRYAYILEGFDKEWINCEHKHEAMYTNIPPGNYTFRVKASNNDNVWCNPENQVQLKITIAPPYWQTWWFKTLLIIFIMLLFYGWNLRRTLRLRMQKQVLEKKVIERTEEIKKQNYALVMQKKELSEQADSLQEANILLKERGEELEAYSEEIKAQSEDLSNANEQLIKLNATKDKLFSIIAHDLKNPFQAIISTTELLKNKADSIDNDIKSKFLDNIFVTAKSANNLLENLLEWARTQLKSIQLTPQTVNIQPIVSKVIGLLSLQATDKKIAINNTINSEILVFADPNMVETIVRNLVSNAIKFTPQSGQIDIVANTCDYVPSSQYANGETKDDSFVNLAQNSTITSMSSPANQLINPSANWVVILVSDTGIGMSGEETTNLFKIDKIKVNTGTAGETGTGLGLILCKEFAEKNNGTIRIHSRLGQGSTFSLYLPANKNTANEVSSAETLQQEGPHVISEETQLGVEALITNTDGGKYHVLLVDDNVNIRKSIAMRLEQYFKVSEASNGAEGLRVAQTEMPDIIVSDVMMPEMDGFEMCEQLKTDERTNHIPVILLTARVSDSSRIKGLNLGANDYLTKPFNIDVLQARISNLLLHHEQLKKHFIRFSIALANNNNVMEAGIENKQKAFVEKLIQITEKNLSDPNFTAEQLSESVNMSYSSLLRKLTAIGCGSPSDFIRSVRLQHAAKLLVSGQNVSDVMYAVGITHRGNFSDSFKKMFGVRPSEYKKLDHK